MPKIRYKETSAVNPYASTASGSRCRKAPPNKAPAEKLTKNNNNLFNLSLFNIKVKMPTKESTLTTATLTKLLSQTPIF